MSEGGSRSPRNLAAYEWYLKGLYAGRLEDRNGCEEAFRCFEHATTEDPGLSLACSAWAHSYLVGAGRFFPSPPAVRRARELAARAVELGPELAETHKVLGELALRGSHDWSRAEVELRHSIALNPADAETRLAYATMLSAVQRYDEAADETREAIRANPGSAPAWETLIELRYRSGALEAAVELAEEVRDRAPNAFAGRYWTGLCYWAMGRTPEALRQLAGLAGPANPHDRVARAVLAGLLGRPEEAHRLVRELEEEARTRYVPLARLASLHAVLGELDRSFELLEKDLREGDGALWREYALPPFDGLRTDPRFAALLEEYHLPALTKETAPSEAPAEIVGATATA